MTRRYWHAAPPAALIDKGRSSATAPDPIRSPEEGTKVAPYASYLPRESDDMPKGVTKRAGVPLAYRSRSYNIIRDSCHEKVIATPQDEHATRRGGHRSNGSRIQDTCHATSKLLTPEPLPPETAFFSITEKGRGGAQKSTIADSTGILTSAATLRSSWSASANLRIADRATIPMFPAGYRSTLRMDAALRTSVASARTAFPCTASSNPSYGCSLIHCDEGEGTDP